MQGTVSRAFAVVALAWAVCASIHAYEPIKPQDQPGDLPGFRKADELYSKSGPRVSGEAKLGAHYFMKAVQGYRLAEYWTRRGAGETPDARFGRAEAEKYAAKAKKTLEEEKARLATGRDKVAIEFCDRMLEYVKELADAAKKEPRK